MLLNINVRLSARPPDPYLSISPGMPCFPNALLLLFNNCIALTTFSIDLFRHRGLPWKGSISSSPSFLNLFLKILWWFYESCSHRWQKLMFFNWHFRILIILFVKAIYCFEHLICVHYLGRSTKFAICRLGLTYIII